MTSGAAAGRRQGLAIASLVLGILGLPTVGLLGVGALLGIVLGVVALVKAGREPSVYGGKGLAIAGIGASVLSILLMPFVLGVLAAIAIPSLLRARVSANETTTIADVRAFSSAEEAFRSATGSYGTPECLAAPSTCVQSYHGPSFLDAQAGAATRAGYRRTFQPGPGQAGPTGITDWTYLAVPVTRNRTGVRAFCADSTGRVCAAARGTPAVAGGRCSDPCQDLR